MLSFVRLGRWSAGNPDSYIASRVGIGSRRHPERKRKSLCRLQSAHSSLIGWFGSHIHRPASLRVLPAASSRARRAKRGCLSDGRKHSRPAFAVGYAKRVRVRLSSAQQTEYLLLLSLRTAIGTYSGYARASARKCALIAGYSFVLQNDR